MGAKKIIDVNLNAEGNLVCECGNESIFNNFSHCDENGNVLKTDEGWKELYLCDNCGQIYHVLDKDKEIITIKENDDEEIDCPCGNTTSSQGFYPCDKKGFNIEPMEGIWHGLYRCDGCNKIYYPVKKDDK